MGKKRIIIDNDTQEVYEGVTRFDNGKVEHGDRHDAAFDEMRRRIKNAPESAKHIPPVRDFFALAPPTPAWLAGTVGLSAVAVAAVAALTRGVRRDRVSPSAPPPSRPSE